MTLEYAVSSLAATTARADVPICHVALGGAEQAPKMGWQMQNLYYTSESLWERQPPPHKHRWAHFSTGLGEAMDAVRTEESREKGQSWEQLFHTVPCAAGISSWESVQLF